MPDSCEYIGKPMILDPPYDGYAVWHEHFFSPTGEGWQFEDDEEHEIWRYDAVEDRHGRIFVMDIKCDDIIVICPDRTTACKIARALARE